MNPQDLYIETERLLIRPYTVEDASAFNQAIEESRDELIPYMPWAKEKPLTLEQRIEKLNGWNKEIQEDTNYTLGIFNKETGEFIGSTGIHFEGITDTVAIGYWVNTKFQKQGYITESTKALTQFAFKNLNTERVAIYCDDENIRSAAIPKRIGFNHEFTYRMLTKDADGNRKRHQVWYIFKEEWTRITNT